MSIIQISSRSSLASNEKTAILNLLLDAANEDGAYPFSEDVTLNIQHDSKAEHMLAYVDEEIAGYAFIGISHSIPKVEIAVSPKFRRHGVGRALLEHICDAHKNIELWAHGNNASARSLALNAGFELSRTLIQMRRSLLKSIDEPQFPHDVTVRTFDAAIDFEAWLTCNSQAFSEHPDQGSWSEQELRLRMSEAWFNPDGFLVAYREDTMVGFHWTKIHSEEIHAEKIGEMYIVGVVPNMRGQGLGRALALAGLAHLRSQGLTSAMLYVDASDTTAVKLYESLGFAHWDNDTLFVKRG